MSQAKYFEAPEVEEIAEDLISKYHQHLLDYSVRIRYVFVDKTPTSGDKEVWGTCRKVSGLNAFLEGQNDDGESFFVITISKEVWDILPMDKKKALVDHELCHAWADVKKPKKEEEDPEAEYSVRLGVKPHDLEEFSCIVRRHGLWRENIEDFVESALKSKGEKK